MGEFGQLPGQQFYLELSIKGERYNPNNIQYLVIKEWIFNVLPTIELMIADEGYLTEAVPMEDASEIEVLLAKSEDDPNPIEMTFLLDDYTVDILGDNRKSLVGITGHLKVDNMFGSQSKSYSNKNSVAVLKQIAGDCGLPFSNPRKIVSSDNMTWLQAAISNHDFIRHVLSRAYIPNDTMFFFGTHKNEFVLTSLLAEMDKKEIQKAKFNVENMESFVKDDSDPDDIVWFGSYNIVNYSGYFNKKVGYGFGYSYYDLNGKVVTKEFSKIEKLTQLSFRNKKKIGTIVNYNDNVKDFVKANLYGVEYFQSLSRNHFLMDNFFANSLFQSLYFLDCVSLIFLNCLSI